MLLGQGLKPPGPGREVNVDQLWPWLLLAALGALHGLNPACGWLQAAACGLRAHSHRQALRALAPIAVGHAVSVALVAAAVALGLTMDGQWLQWPAAGLLALLIGALLRRRSGRGRIAGLQPDRAGIALCSFIVSTAQGAGLMLVPALVPLCLSASPARQITASGSLVLALAAVAVHMAAMLLVTALMATGACHGARAAARWLRRQPR